MGIPLVWIHFVSDGLQRHPCVLLHLWQDFSFKEAFGLFVSRLQILWKLTETELVPIFKLRVVWSILLDGIISQVDVVIVKGIYVRVVLTWAGANVSFFEEKAVQILIYQNPYPDVEFTTFDEKRVFDVLLNYELVAFYSLSWLRHLSGSFLCSIR